ncbi:UNVERIFIED_CONTAM: hypothetical protein Sindi_1328600, partial [Sesamum indicum]
SVQKHKRAQMELADSVENGALSVKGGLRYEKERFIPDKRIQQCKHYDKIGHNKDTCFKHHGTLKWYKELVDKRKRDSSVARGFAVEVATPKETQSRPDMKEELL